MKRVVVRGSGDVSVFIPLRKNMKDHVGRIFRTAKHLYNWGFDECLEPIDCLHHNLIHISSNYLSQRGYYQARKAEGIFPAVKMAHRKLKAIE